MLQKEKTCIKSRVCELLEFEDQGKLNLFCLLGNMDVYFVASEGQCKMKTNIIFRQNKKNLHIFILFKSFTLPEYYSIFTLTYVSILFIETKYKSHQFSVFKHFIFIPK